MIIKAKIGFTSKLLLRAAKRLHNIVRNWIFSQITFSTTLWTCLRLLGMEPERRWQAGTMVALASEIPLTHFPLP
jgi:hypothetical protein